MHPKAYLKKKGQASAGYDVNIFRASINLGSYALRYKFLLVFHHNKAVEKTLFRCLSAVMDYALRVAELGRGHFPLFRFTPAATTTEVLPEPPGSSHVLDFYLFIYFMKTIFWF